MNTKVSQGGQFHSTGSVSSKAPTGELTVPFAEINTLESIALGFRERLFDLVDDDEEILGHVSCTAIGGGDALIMAFGEYKVLIRGRDLFAAWVRQVDPKGAKKLPESVRYASS